MGRTSGIIFARGQIYLNPFLSLAATLAPLQGRRELYAKNGTHFITKLPVPYRPAWPQQAGGIRRPRRLPVLRQRLEITQACVWCKGLSLLLND